MVLDREGRLLVNSVELVEPFTERFSGASETEALARALKALILFYTEHPERAESLKVREAARRDRQAEDRSTLTE